MMCIAQGNAQNITDVVRWSQSHPFSTGRSAGVSGAFGAMGGDLSSVSINPAGIGDYRKSEFVLTPQIINTSADAYFDSFPSFVQNAKNAGLNIGSLGFVLSSNPGTSLTSSNFAISVNNTKTFRRQYNLSGNTPGSITTYFAGQADGKDVDYLDEFIEYPAYNTGAIFDFDEDLIYNTDFDDLYAPVQKSQDVRQSGGAYDISLTWAGEIDHKLNFGIGLSMPIGNFEEVKTYQESDPNNNNPIFESLSYSEFLNTSSLGFNAKLGFIYKEGPLRIGGAFHSPTYFYLQDDYSTEMTYSYMDQSTIQSNTYSSEYGTFDYRIRTPWKAIASIGTTFKSNKLVGFIDLDVEYIDYSSAKYKGLNDPTNGNSAINFDINTKLNNVLNYRLGGEFGYGHFRGRLGAGLEHSPYNADGYYKTNFSFGLGYRGDRFYADLGVYFAHKIEGYYPYIMDEAVLDPKCTIEDTKTMSALTFGFKF